MKKMNKKAESISATILVLLALGLVGLALLIFNMDLGKVSTEIKDSRALNDVYLREGKVDFYVNEILEKGIVRIKKKDNPIPEFISYFKEEILKYKQKEGYVIEELLQVEEQAVSENFEFNSATREISFDLSIKIDKKLSDKLSVSHIYNKKYAIRV